MTSRWILSAWITGAIVAAYRSIFAMPGPKNSNDKVPHGNGDTEADGGYGFFGMLLVIASWIAFCLIILLMPVFILAAEAKMLVGKLYRKWFPRV